MEIFGLLALVMAYAIAFQIYLDVRDFLRSIPTEFGYV